MKRYHKLIPFLLIGAFNLAAQQKRHEISMPLHPWIFITQDFYINYEFNTNQKSSFLARLGYRKENFLEFGYQNADFDAFKLDIGIRWYLKEVSKPINLFLSAKARVEYDLLDLGNWKSADSTRLKGFSFSPELNGGMKITLFNTITASPVLGLRYYFNTLTANDRLTRNPEFWQYDDFSNRHQDWTKNRDNWVNFRRGFHPFLQIDIGYRF
jgi:hypothetical protein